ncbi:hypothetical protein [Parvibacter caecicola]|uniref:hypothetical protein n=1 Tax=Parvibacter caecicola TaxID=747645 RepID=UPI002730B1F7|nr:hypothetical protein [Parvibacter caecicola]
MNPCTANNNDCRNEGGELHQFSAKYEMRKRALIAEVARGEQAAPAVRPAVVTAHSQDRGHWRRRSASPHAARNLSWKIAAAVAAVCVALPVGAYAAANHEELFGQLFGTDARTSTPMQTYEYEKGDGVSHTATIPAHEYVDTDPQVAEALLGNYLMDSPQVVQAGPRTLTINSVVRSENAMVVAYTLQDDPEHPTLVWDERSNVAKGAQFAEGACMRWRYMTAAEAPEWLKNAAAGSGEEPGEMPAESASSDAEASDVFAPIYGSIYVDPQRSTADMLYCYEYLLFPDGVPENTELKLEVGWNDGAMREMVDAAETETVDLTAIPMVPSTTLKAQNGTEASLSPLGLTFDIADVFGVDEEYAELGLVSSIEVRYTDGSSYVVLDGGQNLENIMYMLGSGTKCGMAFNRLVDPGTVASVEVTLHDGKTAVLQ